jgi:hypothetical protein
VGHRQQISQLVRIRRIVLKSIDQFTPNLFVKRIDLVLGESEKGRLSLEFALRDVRLRLAQIEERLGRG